MKAGKSGGTADGARLTEFVRVRGAREHNLKDVDVDIPRDALVGFTGVSGSGKSSLAFGTLYAEAKPRYLGADVAGWCADLAYGERVIFPAIRGCPQAIAE